MRQTKFQDGDLVKIRDMKEPRFYGTVGKEGEIESYRYRMYHIKGIIGDYYAAELRLVSGGEDESS